MPAGELAFEKLALALETTKGTAIATPTHYLPLSGSMKPIREIYRPDETRGTLAEYYRAKTVRADMEWDAEGGLDPNYMPLLFNLFVKGGVTSPTTPTNGVLTRLWTFAPAMTTDTLNSATMVFGDPNVQVFQSAYTMGEELTISADATGTDAATVSAKGWGQFPTRVSAPTFPAQSIGDMVMPGAMQLWIDTSSAIGTTEVTGRFISTEWTIPTGLVRKHYAGGPTASLNFTKHGVGKRHAEAKITVELNDVSVGAGGEYRLWEADTVVKMRIRLNGSLIETVASPGPYYSYVQLDIYGPLDSFDWGDVEGTNRTMTFTVMSQYDATAGYDFALLCQNTRTSI